MFDTLIVQPIFNLLVLIYALIPGHNFGLAIILFTIIIRLLMWPLVKKQLHQAKLMRKIQPDLKRISKESKGDKRKQSMLQLELYKEKGINPFGSIGVALLQLPILFGLYIGLQRVIKDPQEIINFAYGPLQNLPWLQTLDNNIKLFDSSLFGLVDLHRAALGGGNIYIPALIIVIASVVVQYFQAKQLMPNDKDARSLRAILKEAGAGKQADQQEVSAAVGRSTLYLLPAMIFVFTIGLASALGLYWFVGGLVAFIQQSIVLREDTVEMDDLSTSEKTPAKPGSKKSAAKAAAKDIAAIPEAEVVTATETVAPSTIETKPKKKPNSKNRRNKKRRKR